MEADHSNFTEKGFSFCLLSEHQGQHNESK